MDGSLSEWCLLSPMRVQWKSRRVSVMQRWAKSPFPYWGGQLTCVCYQMLRHALIIWKWSTASFLDLLLTSWFHGWCLALRKLFAWYTLMFMVYFSHMCFCYTVPGLLTLYSWTWHFCPSMYFFSSFFYPHPCSSLVKEVFFLLLSRLNNDVLTFISRSRLCLHSSYLAKVLQN